MSPAAHTYTHAKRKETPMPTPSRCRPSGPRARLLSLLALAAALILVPAGQALAEHGEPHLKVNLISVEGGGGEVFEVGSLPPGQPAPISCILPEGGVQEGVCENKPPELEEGLWAQRLDEIPGPNSGFVNWEVVSGSAHPIAPCEAGVAGEECLVFTTNASEDLEVNAVFACSAEKECPGVPLTLIKTGEGNGVVESSQEEPGGIDCRLVGCTEETVGFVEGAEVTLEATPDGESSFGGWHGADAEAAGCDETGATPTCEVVMSAPREVEAQFDELIPHTLTVKATGEGSVSAVPPPAPLSGEISACEEAECSAEYGEGQMVTLEASPGEGKIVEWEGCDSKPSLTECEVVIPAEDATVKAEFVEAPTGTLTVEASGEGSVGAEEPPAPISGGISGCEEGGGAECSAEYFQGETVTLVATPGEHKEVQWTGCTPVGGEPDKCEVEIDAAAVSVKVEFVQISHTLTVEPSGEGSVDGGPISGCEEGGGTCAGPVNEGDTVTLTATPGEHKETVWTAGCDNVPSADECEVTVEAPVTLEVEFVQILHTLTVNTAGSGSGSVSCDGGACAATYPEGEEVTLTASADSGSTFEGWSGGGCSGTGACVVVLEADTAVTATFDAEEKEEEGGDDGGSTPPPPPPPPPTCLTNPLLCNPGLLIANPAAEVRGNKALLKVRCRGEQGARCRGVLKLIAKVKVKGKRRTVVVGKSRYNLPTGSAVRILRAKLTAKGIKLVRRAGKRGLKVKLVGKNARNRTVKLKHRGGGKKRNRRSARR